MQLKMLLMSLICVLENIKIIENNEHPILEIGLGALRDEQT